MQSLHNWKTETTNERPALNIQRETNMSSGCLHYQKIVTSCNQTIVSLDFFFLNSKGQSTLGYILFMFHELAG